MKRNKKSSMSNECSTWNNKKGRNIFKNKSRKLSIFCLLIIGCVIIPKPNLAADFYYPDLTAKSDLLMDADTGVIDIQNNIDEQTGIASLTKLMTVYVGAEEMEEQKIKLTDELPISERAAGIKNQNPDNSGVYLDQGTSMTFNQALQLILVYSDNGVAVAFAEKLSGSEQKHVDKMNQKAQDLGMTQTFFYNVSGLTMKDYGDYQLEGTKSTDYNKSSARDMGILAEHLIKDYPQILDYTSQPSVEYDGYEYSTWNQMLPGQLQEYEGVKGLKTGTSIEAGECYIGYYTTHDHNYISVVLGADSETQDRFTETAVMYNWLDEEINRMIKVSDSETPIKSEALIGAHPANVELYTNYDLMVLKEENIRIFLKDKTFNPTYFDENGKLIKDIPANTTVVTYTFSVPEDNIAIQTVDGEPYEFRVELVAHQDIKQAGYLEKIPEATKIFFTNFYKNIF